MQSVDLVIWHGLLGERLALAVPCLRVDFLLLSGVEEKGVKQHTG